MALVDPVPRCAVPRRLFASLLQAYGSRAHALCHVLP